MRLGWGSEAARSECARLGCSGFSGLGRWVGAGNLVAVATGSPSGRCIQSVVTVCLVAALTDLGWAYNPFTGKKDTKTCCVNGALCCLKCARYPALDEPGLRLAFTQP